MAWYGDADPRDERASFEATGGSRLWPFVLTVFFGILFAGIADLAWLTATGTTAPWFTSTVSAQVYTATLSTATIATLILASLAASKLTLLESRARATVARQVEEGAASPRIPVEAPRSVVLAPNRNPRAEGLDQILSVPEPFAAGPMGVVHRGDRAPARPGPCGFGRGPGSGADGPRGYAERPIHIERERAVRPAIVRPDPGVHGRGREQA